MLAVSTATIRRRVHTAVQVLKILTLFFFPFFEPLVNPPVLPRAYKEAAMLLRVYMYVCTPTPTPTHIADMALRFIDDGALDHRCRLLRAASISSQTRLSSGKGTQDTTLMRT